MWRNSDSHSIVIEDHEIRFEEGIAKDLRAVGISRLQAAITYW